VPTTLKQVQKFAKSIGATTIILKNQLNNKINVNKEYLNCFICKKCKKQYSQLFMIYKKSKTGSCSTCNKLDGGPKSLNYDYVKNIIEKKGVKLLSTEYKSYYKPLTLQCKCGNIYKQKFIIFYQGNGGRCKKCVNSVNYKLNFTKEKVKEVENKYKIKIISEIKNTRQKVKFMCECGNIVENRKLNNILYRHDTKCRNCTANTSNFEEQIYSFIKEIYSGDIITNSRSIIPPLELDIYIPEKNIAFECDGLYWHSEGNGKDKNYHLNKTKECEKKGIQLIHIFENEWFNKQNIVKSIVKSKLGLNKRIGANKTKCYFIHSKEAKKFIQENHIQGKDNSKIYLGLEYQNELVAIMSFGKPRYNKHYDWELVRFVSKEGINVVGGAGKLLNGFKKQYSGSIITYADKRYSNGNMYEKLGFKLLQESTPNYFYFSKNDKFSLKSRVQFQKHKLKSKLEIFDSKNSEYVNMINNGWNRIFDCGNKVYVLNL
jgi:hypothetical protein